ncbi:MAG: CRISPR-associated helicase Cas3' [Rhodospirillales bacterium]|nr:CRISPR-associated helicase Cas3' [Rhodospirillales bacterium]
MTNDVARLARDWPGKGEVGASVSHPAIWHMLDVAACAELLIADHSAFAALTEAQKRAFVVLAALHDVGKISETFRALLQEGRAGRYRHWKLSDVLLTQILDSDLSEAFGGETHARAELYAAVSGHHGGPERSSQFRELHRRRRAIGGPAEQAARDWLSLLLALLPGGTLAGIDQAAARRLSWVLSGLTVAADWVASNQEWFPATSPNITPPEYLALARSRAADAIESAGLSAAAANCEPNGRALTGLPELRPMQVAAADTPLPDGPALALIEDTTGAGKTEAALILAHRMIVSGRARGLFFALPTMATANAMFGRLTKAALRLFSECPAVALVHGRAGLHSGFRELVGASDDPTPEPGCARWLADDRRRALLAEIGVGTIDQVLLGVLPTRFATLRLFGVTDRIMIVDEAHAYDPYMRRQLETLLRMHAFQGGSAIVMTATLPLDLRQRYADAFCAGLGRPAEALDHTAYPAFTVVGADTRTSPIQVASGTRRTVRAERLKCAEEAIERLLAGAEAGAACLWVRNAVDDAIDTVGLLRARGCEARLLHARFALGDRLQHEHDLLERFGPSGSARAGQVLVATQVVEASLDLDFDVMVSDLAPIGALIQRAGRLWRHLDRRPASRRPVTEPVLSVLAPDPDDVVDPHWLHAVLDHGAHVYRHADQWRTARALFDAGSIRTPDGLRDLIEAVHGLDRPDVPEALAHAELEAEGVASAEAALALQNVVRPEDGYLHGTGASVWSDEKFPTRLGEEQQTLVLARRQGAQLEPWCRADTPARAWALSEVRCSRWRVLGELPSQDDPAIAAAKADWPKGKRDHVILCAVAEDGRITDGLRYDRTRGLAFSATMREPGDLNVNIGGFRRCAGGWRP